MKKIIQVRISKGENQYVAECLDLPVVTQAKTLDELTENLREAISLHLRGEDLAELDLAVAGPLRYRLKLGDYVNPGTLLAHVGDGEVRSPAPGEVRTLRHKEGDVVAPGDALAELSADQNHVWEALRALLVVGENGRSGRCAAVYSARAGVAGKDGPAGGAHGAGDSSARQVIQ